MSSVLFAEQVVAVAVVPLTQGAEDESGKVFVIVERLCRAHCNDVSVSVGWYYAYLYLDVSSYFVRLEAELDVFLACELEVLDAFL